MLRFLRRNSSAAGVLSLPLNRFQHWRACLPLAETDHANACKADPFNQ